MGTKARLARLLSQERITGTDEEIAIAHETNRQSAVKEIFVHIFFMAKFRFIPGVLTVQKAEAQYLSGRGDDEAAHCAPGQILSGTQAIYKLLAADDDLQLIVENLFGKTDEMHGRFNKADTSAEDKGLRDAFGAACNYVADKGRIVRFNRAEEFYPYIDNAFNLYRTQGLRAFADAITFQQQKQDAGEGLTGTTRAELIFILGIYQRQLQNSYSTLETVQGLYPEDLWRDYRSLV